MEYFLGKLAKIKSIGSCLEYKRYGKKRGNKFGTRTDIKRYKYIARPNMCSTNSLGITVSGRNMAIDSKLVGLALLD